MLRRTDVLKVIGVIVGFGVFGGSDVVEGLQYPKICPVGPGRGKRV